MPSIGFVKEVPYILFEGLRFSGKGVTDV